MILWVNQLLQAILALQDGHFNIKLILEVDGFGSVVEWMKQAQMVYDLCGLKQVKRVLPFQLTDGTFAVYLQMSQGDKTDAIRIKKALFANFTAYEQFTSRSLRPGMTVNVYLAELRKLKTLF